MAINALKRKFFLVCVVLIQGLSSVSGADTACLSKLGYLLQYEKHLHPLMENVYEVKSQYANYRHEQVGAKKIASYFNKIVIAAGNVGDLQGVPALDGVILDNNGQVLYNYSLKTPVLKNHTDSRNIMSAIHKAIASINKHSTIHAWARNFHLYYQNNQFVAPSMNNYWREKLNQVNLVTGLLGVGEKKQKKTLVVINLDTHRPLKTDANFIYIQSSQKYIPIQWLQDAVKRTPSLAGILFLSNNQSVFVTESGIK